MWSRAVLLTIGLGVAWALVANAAGPEGRVSVSECEDLAAWTAIPADGVSLDLSLDDGIDGRALRLDFDIPGGGYAVARTEVDLLLPENYVFRFSVRGNAPVNHLEFKVIDEVGDSVWWSVRRDFVFPREWKRLSIKKRHLDFAWGPKGGGDIHRVSAIEFAVTAGSGGSGQVWIDQIELVPLAAAREIPADLLVRASTEDPAHAAALAVDGNLNTAWEPRQESSPWLSVDLGSSTEYSALYLTWVDGRHATDYVVETSEDGLVWVTLREVSGADGGFDPLHLPESSSRFVRLRVLRAFGTEPVALAEMLLQPVDWAESRVAFFERLATRVPRGHVPRGMLGEQAYWTVVGIDADPREALLGEDGALEFGAGLGSIEPFLHDGERLFTWADGRIDQTLAEGYLPIPTVRWQLPGWELRETAFATGRPGASWVVVRYSLTNQGSESESIRLALALRPYQVNPPSQTLNLQGGISSVHAIEMRGDDVYVDGQPRVRSLRTADGFGAAKFDAGDIVTGYLSRGRLPQTKEVRDDFGAASAALVYDLELQAGATETIDVLVPLYPEAGFPPLLETAAKTWVDDRLALAQQRWNERAHSVELQLPPAAREIEETFRAQIGYILVNRAGPGIQPGCRSYARSWIRDGALTSWALLRTGHVAPALEFLKWYAPFQYENGKIPCVVDVRGADPVDEHDSTGEFIFLVREVYRATNDMALLREMWPGVVNGIGYLDSLRQQRRSPEFRSRDQAHFYGLLPPSISHEGYSAKPMHSYWDDFFAVRGFRDAVFLAKELGELDVAARFEIIRDQFEEDLSASVAATLLHHGIDFVPGCADLGDFDATSTTIALTPADATSLLPAGSVTRTFERYWEFFENRRSGREPWDAYTPYELRTVGTFVRLGWRQRAHELLDFFLEGRRPAGWRQWPEVVRSEPRQAAFLGDLPHTWVGSDYVRSVLDMLAYASDDALILAAGIPAAWLAAPGVKVGNLPTPYGELSYTAARSADSTRVVVAGGLVVPPNGVVLDLPLAEHQRSATVNGQPASWSDSGGILVWDLPATVVVGP